MRCIWIGGHIRVYVEKGMFKINQNNIGRTDAKRSYVDKAG
jgi:hypothetical protein